MAGAYCRYCDHRCFVLRELPDGLDFLGSRTLHMATCAEGMAHDRQLTGYDHTTAINPAARQLAPDTPPENVVCSRVSDLTGGVS